MRSNCSIIVLAGIAAASGCSHLEERSRSLDNPATPARTIALQVCSNCHGVDGNPVSPNFPALAGQRKEYLVAQLKEFRARNRLDPAGFEYMWGISRKLTDEQIAGLGDYFSGQKPVSPGPGDKSLAVAGERIFRQGVPEKAIPACATCHGEQAEGRGEIPRLAFQHAAYLYKQLRVFQRTAERPQGSVMKIIAHGLTDANMASVSEFLQGMAGDLQIASP